MHGANDAAEVRWIYGGDCQMNQSYYNEIDPAAAAMLRSLIAAGHIAPGIVDERSIEDVRPDELAGYAQCHFFAGIGIWSLALRQAGIPDDYRVWSMSCPCQPFSAAGKGEGFADKRHLWPAAYHLISQCRPERIFGEQVASKDTDPWIDLVQTDLEALGYAFGCVPFPSAGVGAPHIRDRAYWVGNASSTGLERFSIGRGEGWDGYHAGDVGQQLDATSDGGWLVHPQGLGRGLCDTAHIGEADAHGDLSADASGMPTNKPQRQRLADQHAGPVNGHWADADWLYCRDGKWRPVEPGTFPLAYGMPRSMGAMPSELRGLAELAGLFGDSLKRAKQYRVQQLKGYGNALNAQAAQAFIEAAA